MEYLVRIEQGRDRNPSAAVINALADALRLDAAEREHLRHAAKCSSGTCGAAAPPPRPDVRPAVRSLLAQLEPGIAFVTNRLGDVLAHTSGFDLLARPAGLLDSPSPNLTRFVFTDERARRVFPDWDQVADERAFHLSLGAPSQRSEQLIADLTALAGPSSPTACAAGAFPGPARRRGAIPSPATSFSTASCWSSRLPTPSSWSCCSRPTTRPAPR